MSVYSIYVGGVDSLPSAKGEHVTQYHISLATVIDSDMDICLIQKELKLSLGLLRKEHSFLLTLKLNLGGYRSDPPGSYLPTEE